MLVVSMRASCRLQLFCSANAAWSTLIISSGSGLGGGRGLGGGGACRPVDLRGFFAVLPSLGAAPASGSEFVLPPSPLSDELLRRISLGVSPTPAEAAASMATALSRLLAPPTTLGALPRRSDSMTHSLDNFHLAEARLYAAERSGRRLFFFSACRRALCLDSSCSVAKHARMIARYLPRASARARARVRVTAGARAKGWGFGDGLGFAATLTARRVVWGA